MSKPRSIVIRTPDDMHLHLRQGTALADYAKRTSSSFGRAVVMPNLVPPISTPELLESYRNEIQKLAPGLEPLMTFKLLPGMSPEMVTALKGAGSVAGKYYPEGVTTNSEDGIRNTDELYPILEVMEDSGLVLCIHGEEPGAPVLDRESAFLPQFEEMAVRFPRLRMVFEHVSTAEGVSVVEKLPANISATVTVHHLLFTLEDLMATGLDPHLYCKPVVKTEVDRREIQRVVLEQNRKFFFGSDSAPHPVAAKTTAPAAAGVYSAPVAMPLLIDFFDTNNALDKLEDFTSLFGPEFYRLPLNREESTWVNIPWQVPGIVDGVVPLCAGKQLLWTKKAAG
jgi:dihydroorotase